MPVRSCSRCWICESQLLPSVAAARSSSSCGENPGRITPPSASSAGVSSAIAASIRSVSSGKSSSRELSCSSSGAAKTPSSVLTPGSTRSEAESVCRSRGPALPTLSLPTIRSRSRTTPMVSRSSASVSGSRVNCSTASSRATMASWSQSGRSSQPRRRRPPIGVTVWSSTPSREPFLPEPNMVSTSSRLR